MPQGQNAKNVANSTVATFAAALSLCSCVSTASGQELTQGRSQPHGHLGALARHQRLGGLGDAVIGIHGPLGDDSEIGTTGARVSHGCIRLHDSDLVRLRQVPPGTPINIVG